MTPAEAPVPGVAGERTSLAWQRTSASVLVLAVATLGLAARLGEAAQLLTAAFATVVSASTAGLVRRRRGAPTGVRLVALVVAVVALAVAGLAAAVVSADARTS